MDPCIFCLIARHKSPASVLFEDDEVMVFPSVKPKAQVHLLIIPKRHIDSVAHLQAGDTAIAGKLLLTAKQLAADQGLKGYKIVINVGRDGGQVVDHLHLHLLGGQKLEE